MMKTTVKIEGMMCPRCAGRVKKALEALEGVTEAAVSHENGTAVITAERDIAEETVKDTVTNAGYTYVGVLA